MAKKTIFISGIAGFLGSHAADIFLADGHSVVGMDNLSGGLLDNVPKEADFYEYDLLDFKKNLQHLAHVDVIFHAAAAAYDGLSHFSPYAINLNIVSGSASLFSAAVQRGIKKIVFCSSMARYGDHKAAPFTELMAPRPVSPYGLAKLHAELLLVNLAETHKFDWTICVPHNVVGPRQRYDDPYRNVAAITANRLLQGLRPIIFGDGEQLRCFSPVQDVLQVLDRLTFDAQTSGQIFNLGPDHQPISINQLCRMLCNITGQDLQPLYFDQRPREVLVATCSSEKAKRLLGFESRVTLQDSLQELVNWIQKRGPKSFDYHIDLEVQSSITPAPWRERI